ncbi:MAG: universal stress protein [Candidatus Binatia bacterium]
MYEDFKRVLVTTDFSALGDAAIGHAFRVGADHDAEVVLCHVIETPPTPNPLYAHYSPSGLFQPEQRRLAEEQARKALLERVPKEPPLSEVKHRTRVTHGEPIAEILRLAEQERADLLVIATHGRTGLKHFFLGSVVERVIRHAHCPVLVVR